MDSNCVDVLNKQADEIKCIISKITQSINTECIYSHWLCSVSCLNEQIWAIDNFVIELNTLLLWGARVTNNFSLVMTISWDFIILMEIYLKRKTQRDIAKTIDDLVYTDTKDGTVNIGKSTAIQAMNRQQGWRLHCFCSTSLLTSWLSW